MTSQSDYDSPWKDVLDLFFEAAIELFFPQAHAQIDWSRGYEFLDKELQKITADAVVVQAHLMALRTRHNPQERLQLKWQLTRRLYERGFSKREIIGLYRFLDWVLTLPDDLTAKFKDQLAEYEEECKVKYVTSIERHGIEKGLRIGLQKGSANLLLRQLPQRFGALEESATDHIRALPLEEIEALSDAQFGFAARADLDAWLEQHPLPATSSANVPAIDRSAN